jgi:hypothetical protein
VDNRFHESDERLELYALGRLSDSDVIRIEEHLLICDSCRDRLDDAANFAVPIRDELRKNPLPHRSRESSGVMDWLRGFMKPQFALAGALAMVLVGVVVFRPGSSPLVPVATLQLTAMRGADLKSVAPARELDLTFGDAPVSGAALNVEVVDAGGGPVWHGSPTSGRGGVHARIAKALPPGEYFARLYDSPGHLVHEYAFRVKG